MSDEIIKKYAKKSNKSQGSYLKQGLELEKDLQKLKADYIEVKNIQKNLLIFLYNKEEHFLHFIKVRDKLKGNVSADEYIYKTIIYDVQYPEHLNRGVENINEELCCLQTTHFEALDKLKYEVNSIKDVSDILDNLWGLTKEISTEIKGDPKVEDDDEFSIAVMKINQSYKSEYDKQKSYWDTKKKLSKLEGSNMLYESAIPRHLEDEMDEDMDPEFNRNMLPRSGHDTHYSRMIIHHNRY